MSVAEKATNLDVEQIRKDFPILKREVKGNALAYFDNAATTQKPQSVIDAISHYYQTMNANIHRGIHSLSEEATAAFEETRETVKSFLNAGTKEEIVFTRGVTESINLIAYAWGRANIKKGDEIIISQMEHHSNIVPWQILCQYTGAELKIIPVNDKGELIMTAYEKLLSSKTKLVSVVHASNTLGTINPVEEIIAKAHQKGALVVLDGAQSASHLQVDLQALDCDFFVFSGHKIYGPTGAGVLYGKKELLEKMPPFQGGGEMIKEVTFAETTYAELPYKFEAGTPNIADTIALKEAIAYINKLGKANIAAYEQELLQYAESALEQIPELTIYGKAKNKVSIISFVAEGVHHQDMAIMLDNKGIAIRTGHHCTQPLMERYNIKGTSRVSMSFYNKKEEIDRLAEGIKKTIQIMK